MEKVEWKVEGMDCTNCALTITRYLRKEGLQEVNVNFIGGDVSFETDGTRPKEELSKGIADLGYKVVSETISDPVQHAAFNMQHLFANHLQRFLFCLPFTLVLMLHMLPWHI
ncbi:MAG TPA: cation transporter, partial [Ferruginibacter sp.]|nr:cation transporter [Ferruginibacter sp.]